MAYRGRRRTDAIVLTVIALAAGAGTAVLAAIGDTERIDRYVATAEVNVDHADITEVIDYDFGSEDRHGIFRDVPGLDPTATVMVASGSAPAEFVVQRSSFGGRIRIGDPDQTIDGRHRYQVSYPIDVELPDGLISWNAIGSDWNVAIRNIELHLLAPFELADPRCSKGQAGSWDGCTVTQPEPGHLLVEVGKLDSLEGITISAWPSTALDTPPTAMIDDGLIAPDPGTGVLSPAIVAALTALVAAGIISMFIKRQGREMVWAGGSADAAFGPQFGETYPVKRVDHDDLASLASTEFAPPKGLSAWQGGILFSEQTTQDHQSAWLLERAIAGEIRIEGNDKDLTIHDLGVDSTEHEALQKLFGGRDKVTLGSYDPQFASGWSALASQLEQWQQDSKLWNPSGERNRTLAMTVGFLLFVSGILVLIPSAIASNRAGLLWLIGVAIGAGAIGAGFALMLRSWELRIRTPEGSGLWILVESFRRFINGSDAQHVEAAAKQGRLLEYTAWAVALDEADHWADVMTQAQVSDPDLYPMNALHMANVGTSLSSATASTIVAPSSSGSSGGGGGGGSVGGGGGGGGGGSW